MNIEIRGRDQMNREPRTALPMPEAKTPWAGGTKDRLVAKSTVDTSPEIERLVSRAVTRAKCGDRDAVRFLYLRYADNVYGYVRTIVRDHHDAEDVTQQVFAKLITAIAKYEQRGVPFVAWLLRMSHNVAVDAVRARRTTPAEEIFGPDDAVCEDAPERARSLHAALAALPEDQRQVVVLRHVLGLSPVEIAEQLGRTNSSVYGLHHRGRRALCAELERLDSMPLTAARGRMAVAA
jgi:RNA polymerase sigma-70 factor (ECF subfamily)